MANEGEATHQEAGTPGNDLPPLLERIPSMTIDELLALLESDRPLLDPKEYQLIKQKVEQYKMMVDLRNAKRNLEDPDEYSAGPSERPKKKFKHTNIEKLTPGMSLRRFADWKADMARLFDESPSKFSTD